MIVPYNYYINRIEVEKLLMQRIGTQPEPTNSGSVRKLSVMDLMGAVLILYVLYIPLNYIIGMY